MRKILLFILLCTCIAIKAQKPPLNHSVYDNWKSITRHIISDDGKWVAYPISPQQGDGWLYILNTLSGQKDSVARGTNPSFSQDCRYITYQVTPTYTEVCQAKKKKLKEDQKTKNSIEIRKLPENETINVPGVKSFAVPSEKSLWMAYLLEKKPTGKQDNKQSSDSTKTNRGNQKKSGKTPEPKGTDLIILNPDSKKEYSYPDVTEYLVKRPNRKDLSIRKMQFLIIISVEPHCLTG